MDTTNLERRRDPRTQAFVPILVRYESAETDTPAHLLDLSSSGAALLTTEGNAPQVGDKLDLEFEVPPMADGQERIRRETGIVMHLRRPERGVTRVGVRFIHRPHLGTGLFGPRELLDNHRRGESSGLLSGTDRWEFLRRRPQRETYRSPAGTGAN